MADCLSNGTSMMRSGVAPSPSRSRAKRIRPLESIRRTAAKSCDSLLASTAPKARRRNGALAARMVPAGETSAAITPDSPNILPASPLSISMASSARSRFAWTCHRHNRWSSPRPTRWMVPVISRPWHSKAATAASPSRQAQRPASANSATIGGSTGRLGGVTGPPNQSQYRSLAQTSRPVRSVIAMPLWSISATERTRLQSLTSASAGATATVRNRSAHSTAAASRPAPTNPPVSAADCVGIHTMNPVRTAAIATTAAGAKIRQPPGVANNVVGRDERWFTRS